MFASRFVPGSLLIAAVLFAFANPSLALLPGANANAPAKKAHHLDSLHKAAHELKHAHTAANGKNGGKAGQHVAAAIGHIEEAIQHHKTNHLNQTRTGLGKREWQHLGLEQTPGACRGDMLRWCPAHDTQQ